MIVYICTKFHENILNGITVMERTQKVNGRMDRQMYGWMDRGHDIIRPVFDGHIKSKDPDKTVCCFFFPPIFTKGPQPFVTSCLLP